MFSIHNFLDSRSKVTISIFLKSDCEIAKLFASSSEMTFWFSQPLIFWGKLLASPLFVRNKVLSRKSGALSTQSICGSVAKQRKTEFSAKHFQVHKPAFCTLLHSLIFHRKQPFNSTAVSCYSNLWMVYLSYIDTEKLIFLRWRNWCWCLNWNKTSHDDDAECSDWGFLPGLRDGYCPLFTPHHRHQHLHSLNWFRLCLWFMTVLWAMRWFWKKVFSPIVFKRLGEEIDLHYIQFVIKQYSTPL